MSMTISSDLSALDEYLDHLGDGVDEAVRPAAQKGAQVLYDYVRRNAPVSERAHMFHGTHAVYGPYQPGSLRDSIYQVYSKDNSGQSKATYHVSWNHKKVPYGFMVEFGTSTREAHPFIRPAVALLPAASDAVEMELMKRVGEII
ncbi:HK97-gp10 family putative phage morphogenesis protein [Paraburkholderia unamae]|uniref:HK97 gp10 family phage protein n=1 Tax=Paraburkholderia unamae TaxID=219649 RepID=A0ABX5KW79_9BURK|nr:HK97-gp10 family putative phage morphogenesis protein [Paraburkholderia unamae]PVX86477.1 HK97 gp10 family phage protein [Paraburkholderia unamae]